MPPSQNNRNAPSDMEPNQKSQYQWLKDSGYGSVWNLGLSYGLNIHNPDDLEETMAILKGLRDMDQKAWEERQMAKK
ncbi:uncharacterized protein BO97DRAFT_406361 [Aspergillus homomorphus CBS 101889]|uniref:Uncharacterized protein n=1 Tax=Aspergillus homomorphus (strain CBS 101889) TaxID=1450537 RepID=A0A395HUD6_ASPHC|nr:hypothetical protein BO97DRAFT_406361 [Aspergillus homomorphus CBS 101889]RAL11129.1 hypothetical protein BO97DRAFT_406361 [Aspergillus homomorphus CBS 101889]